MPFQGISTRGPTFWATNTGVTMAFVAGMANDTVALVSQVPPVIATGLPLSSFTSIWSNT